MNSILHSFDAKQTRLPNGLRVLVREDHSAPVVAIFTHVLAGYFDEPDEWVGISHVLEHMYFKGTPTRGPGAIAQQTKSAGGYLNASTIYDHTSYYTVLPAAALEEGLDIQSDALLNSVIDEDELRKELLVIIQEAKRKLDTPPSLAHESLFALMFDRHRMGRWRIGTEAQLSGFTRSDVAGFFERHYTADAILLVIAGAVEAGRVFELVAERYGGLRTRSGPQDRGPAAPAATEFRTRELTGDVVQTHIELGWHTPPSLHADTPYLDILALILGQGRASHLYRRVRDSGLALGVRAYNYTPTTLGVFGVSLETQPQDAQACVQATCETVVAACNGLISDDDVARAKSVLEARLLRGLETMEGQANHIAEWEALGDWRLGKEYLDTVMSASLDDVRRVARAHLALEQAAIFAYRPRETPPLDLTLATLRPHDS